MKARQFLVSSACVVLVLSLASCFFLKYPRNGIYLVPKGYVGDVIVVYGQPDGVELETENGLFVYRIPSDGILKVKNPGYAGIVNTSYFYVDEEGNRERIEYLRITGDRDPQGLPQNKYGNISIDDLENRIFVMNAGGLGSFNTRTGIVQFSRFIVATPRASDLLYDKMETRTTAIQRELTSRAESDPL